MSQPPWWNLKNTPGGRLHSLSAAPAGYVFLRVILWNLSAFLDSTSILFWLSYSAASAPQAQRNRMFYLEGFSGFEQDKPLPTTAPKGVINAQKTGRFLQVFLRDLRDEISGTPLNTHQLLG
jgi:hypothetical protein